MRRIGSEGIIAASFIALVAATSCTGSTSGSPAAKRDGPCEQFGPHLGCSCTLEKDLACAQAMNDGPDVVQCVKGTFTKLPQGCPNGNVCGDPDDSTFTGAVDCNIFSQQYDLLKFTLPDAPCSSEASFACSLDVKSILRCTNQKWTAFQGCGTKQCAFTGSGTQLGCL